jgi:hypothetical protein
MERLFCFPKSPYQAIKSEFMQSAFVWKARRGGGEDQLKFSVVYAKR